MTSDKGQSKQVWPVKTGPEYMFCFYQMLLPFLKYLGLIQIRVRMHMIWEETIR